MHLEPLKEVEPAYPMTAVFQKTAPQPSAPWVLPGDYSVVLSAGGKSFSQPFAVKMDPRLKVSPADLAKQFELSKALCETRAVLIPIGKSFEALIAGVTKAREKAGDQPIKEKIEAFQTKLQEFADPARVRTGQTLQLDILSKVEKLFADLQEVDAGPTPQLESATLNVQRDAKSVIERWRAIPQDVAAVNSALEASGLEKIKFP
jgi:hypothetical protein